MAPAVRWARPVAVLVAAAVLADCSGGGKKVAVRRTTSTSTTLPTTTTQPPVAPLTGLPQPDPAKLGRPALTVKIENAPEARPQAGMDAADVVFEEEVEGGLTRFLVVFQSRDAAPIGPIRSVRPVDPDIISAIGGLFAYSGGTAPFVARIKRAPVRLVGPDQLGKAYSRRSGKSAPHNLFSSTAALYKGAKPDDHTPPPLFQFLAAGQPFVADGPARHVDVPISGSSRVTWDWDQAASVYRRGENGTPHTVEGGAQLSFANVIVQIVPYSNFPGARDPAGNPVPAANVTGSGPAFVYSQGQVRRATWTKGAATTVTTYTDATGQQVRLTPGATWVELAPTGTAVASSNP